MRIAAAIVLALAPLAGASAQDRSAQARVNYQRILNGTIGLSQLTPQEQADVVEFDRRMRAARKPDTRTVSQRCIDAEIKRAGGSASALERRIIDMKCREAGE